MTKMILRCCFFVLGCTLCSTLSIDNPPKVPLHSDASAGPKTFLKKPTNAFEKGVRAAALSASVVVATMTIPPVPSSLAAVPTLNEAIVELSETSYPILRSLDPANFQSFSVKVGELLLNNINADKLGKSIDLVIDVLDSASPEQLANLNTVLSETYGPLSTESCTLVPLPPMSVVDRFATIAAERVDKDKLQTFQQTWKPSLDALKKTDNSICLPPTRASLDKMALAQADLGRSFGKTETKAFVSYTGPMLKTSITPKKALALVEDAKAVAPRASAQVTKDFAAAGKKAEAASKLEIARNKAAAKRAGP